MISPRFGYWFLNAETRRTQINAVSFCKDLSLRVRHCVETSKMK